MKNKKLILIPASAAERIYPLRPENRLLSAVGQFEPKRLNCWYPVQSYFLTTQNIDEANAVFHRLCKTVLRNGQTMRRFCAANPDDPFGAVCAAMAAMNVCGELAEARRLKNGTGNATFRTDLIDAVFNLTEEELTQGVRYEVYQG